jgi:hypothetical protein
VTNDLRGRTRHAEAAALAPGPVDGVQPHARNDDPAIRHTTCPSNAGLEVWVSSVLSERAAEKHEIIALSRRQLAAAALTHHPRSPGSSWRACASRQRRRAGSQIDRACGITSPRLGRHDTASQRTPPPTYKRGQHLANSYLKILTLGADPIKTNLWSSP